MQNEILNQIIKLEDYKLFEKIVPEIKTIFRKIGIDSNNKYLYYERKKNGTSILAIQLINGNKNDVSNYMVFGCRSLIDSTFTNKSVCCDIYLYADAKSGNYAQNILNVISKQIIEFFEYIENDLCIKNELTKEISFLIPLNQWKIISSSDEQNNIKTKILSIFKKR